MQHGYLKIHEEKYTVYNLYGNENNARPVINFHGRTMPSGYNNTASAYNTAGKTSGITQAMWPVIQQAGQLIRPDKCLEPLVVHSLHITGCYSL